MHCSGFLCTIFHGRCCRVRLCSWSPISLQRRTYPYSQILIHGWCLMWLTIGCRHLHGGHDHDFSLHEVIIWSTYIDMVRFYYWRCFSFPLSWLMIWEQNKSFSGCYKASVKLYNYCDSNWGSMIERYKLNSILMSGTILLWDLVSSSLLRIGGHKSILRMYRSTFAFIKLKR